MADTDTPRKAGHKPALLYALLAAKPVTVGELVDFANGLPDEWLATAATALALSVIADYRSSDRQRSRRRRLLVILGAALTRLAFDIERIPRSRDAVI